MKDRVQFHNRDRWSGTQARQAARTSTFDWKRWLLFLLTVIIAFLLGRACHRCEPCLEGGSTSVPGAIYPPATTGDGESVPVHDPDPETQGNVLICHGSGAIAYHRYRCRGLLKCTHRISYTTIENARARGRRACKICY